MSEIGEEEIARAPVYDGSIEVRLDDKGGVDEVVGLGVLFHIERMSNGEWFFILTRPDQSQEAFWLSGKGKVEVSLRERRPAPTTGPNAAPWTLADALLQPALERARREERERCAKVAEDCADMIGRIMGAGWRGNPHMSGDDRNFMHGAQRRRHDDQSLAAAEHTAAAIRKGPGE